MAEKKAEAETAETTDTEEKTAEEERLEELQSQVEEAAEAAAAAETESEGEEEAAEEADGGGLLETVRRVASGTVGAGTWIRETSKQEVDQFLHLLQDFVGTLVEKGEVARQDGEKLIKEILERRKTRTRKTAEDVQETVEERVDASIDRILEKMSIPTKGDVEELSQKIEALDEKVESLLEERRTTPA